ncbi:MAG TPA: efflux RND transporter periplasmic adaptor subunit [bacterium]|nr:efflux RND transporter periplasmic adaptor subunit [bacterium]
MQRRVWGWLIVTVALVVGVLAGRGLGPVGSGATAQAPTSARAQAGRGRQQVPDVGVGHPSYESLPVTLQLTASIASLREAVLLPQTSGYLERVTVRPGARVTEGEVLATIDHGQLDAQVAQSQAQLAAAEAGVQSSQASLATAQAQYLNSVAGVRSAQAQLGNAKAGLAKAQATLADEQATYRREVMLVQEGADAQQTLDDDKAALISDQSDVQAAQAQIGVAEAQLAEAQAQADAAQQQIAAATSQVRAQQGQAAGEAAALQSAQVQLGYATITAPFDGVVVSRDLDPGAYVTPGTSTPIVTVADVNHLYVAVNVAEADLTLLHQGAAVRLLVDAYPGRTFSGTVTRIAGGVDPSTRTIDVEIDIPNRGHLLSPGMYATAQITAGTQRVLVVPLSALVTVGDQHFLWKVAEGRTTEVPVTTGQATGDVVAITGGVSASDTVVFRGSDLVREGQAVRATAVAL